MLAFQASMLMVGASAMPFLAVSANDIPTVSVLRSDAVGSIIFSLDLVA